MAITLPKGTLWGHGALTLWYHHINTYRLCHNGNVVWLCLIYTCPCMSTLQYIVMVPHISPSRLLHGTQICYFGMAHHRLRGSASPVLSATHHSYGSLAWLSDFFPHSSRGQTPPTDFHVKWLNRRGFTQGCAYCSKNRNFSYHLISRATRRSKFCKFLDLKIFRSILPLTLEVRERTPLILHRSSMKVT